MQKTGKTRTSQLNLIIPITILLIVVADILTKNWIRSFPPDGRTIYKVWFFSIIHITNTGSAFGAFQAYSVVLTAVAIIGLFAISGLGVYIYRKYPAIRQHSEQDCTRFTAGRRPRQPDRPPAFFRPCHRFHQSRILLRLQRRRCGDHYRRHPDYYFRTA